MKNACLLFFTALSCLAFGQSKTSSLQTSAAIAVKTNSINVFHPDKMQVTQKLFAATNASFKQEQVKVINQQKSVVSVEKLSLHQFSLIGELNGKQTAIEEKAKLSVFNETVCNKETGVYSFSLKEARWKGVPYIYCTNCGTALLQLKVEENKKYLVQISLAAENENDYELLLFPNMLAPETFHFSAGAQELIFVIEPKASGYLSYYLRCVKPGNWKLSKVQISEQ